MSSKVKTKNEILKYRKLKNERQKSLVFNLIKLSTRKVKMF